ncbi:MAG: glucose-6-phosphate isomerase [Desulfovibrionaceae bacterium]|nr:glucose-6-phosphate isomerase [Desulfovibrionaceae bacterium]
MTCTFSTQHMWDSLYRSAPSRLAIDSVIERIREEYSDGELPFLSLSHFDELQDILPHFKEFFQNRDSLIIIGIGGSCVGIKALVQLLSPEQDINATKRIYFAENVDSHYLALLQKTLNPHNTAILAISKSGNTIETVSQYMLFKQWLIDACADAWKEHCAIVTDERTGFLFLEATRYNLLCATIPHAMGGRYSVLSAVGILPLVFLEKDYTALMEGALSSARNIIDNLSDTNNILWQLVIWQYVAEQQGLSQTILFSYIPRSMNFGLWFMQLWAESLGKEGKGTFPIFAQGVVDQHSLQQMFLDGKKQSSCIFLYTHETYKELLYINTDNPNWSYLQGRTLTDILSAEYQGTVQSFIKEHIPHIECGIRDISEYSIGSLFVFFQAFVFILGRILEINPLDQPAVEYGKQVTKTILQEHTYSTTT